MEFERDAEGTLTALPAPSIDTGMGLERISAVLQGTLSNYDTELFTPILDATARLVGRPYGGTMEPADVSMRVVADHMRAMTFLIADGVVPSNEWRGYVLRKIMRRAMRHGRKLGLHEPFLHSLVDVLVREMGDAYPELKAGRDAVVQVVTRRGGALRCRADRRAARGSRTCSNARPTELAVLPGDEAFKLYDTYGLPRDFIEDLRLQPGPAVRCRGLRTRDGRPAREGARQERLRRPQGRGLHASASDDDARALGSDRRRVRGLCRDATLQDVPVLALFDDAKQQVDESAGGRRAAGWLWSARRSTSRPAVRCPIRAGSRPRGRARE